MILSNESGGSSVLLEKDNLNRLVLLLDKKAPSHAKTVADIYSVLGHLCKTELIANKVKSAVKIERISKGWFCALKIDPPQSSIVLLVTI